MTERFNLMCRLSKIYRVLPVVLLGCALLAGTTSARAQQGPRPDTLLKVKRLVVDKNAKAICIKAGLRLEKCRAVVGRQTPIEQARRQ